MGERSSGIEYHPGATVLDTDARALDRDLRGKCGQGQEGAEQESENPFHVAASGSPGSPTTDVLGDGTAMQWR
ncbi:hypothetical protein McPS_18960 [Marichromatium sp. PS1]